MALPAQCQQRADHHGHHRSGCGDHPGELFPVEGWAPTAGRRRGPVGNARDWPAPNSNRLSYGRMPGEMPRGVSRWRGFRALSRGGGFR